MILRTLARASSSSFSATPYDALSAGMGKVSSQVPFVYAKKSSPGFTAVLRVVRSTPNVPNTGLVTAGAGAGAAPLDDEEPPPQAAATAATKVTTAALPHFATCLIGPSAHARIWPFILRGRSVAVSRTRLGLDVGRNG